MKQFLSRAGFTLLELMVVIGIIGLLIAAATTSYSTVQKKARDSKRKTDLKNIQNAMEQYYSTCGFTYPKVPATNKVPTTIKCPTQPTAIMSPVPVDPSLPATANKYDMSHTAAANDGTTYQICTNNLETETPATYCLNNQQ
jgi:general secretion pathway protein G